MVSTKKKFNWTDEAQKAFKKIKLLLTTAPVLINPDFEKKFYLHCDTSDYGIDAVLVQLNNEGHEKPIVYMSKKLNTAQSNYSVTERECLTAMEAIKKNRCYLELQEFEVITDHSSFLWLMRQPDLTGRLARWVFKLQSYSFTISHRKGKNNEEIATIEMSVPEIDFNSPSFQDEDYKDL